jgi:hypothetical protein
MDEQQVRELVREALARHLGTSGPTFDVGRNGSLGAEASANAAPSRPSPDVAAWKAHLSHGRFVFLAPSEPDSPCIVEPHVRCHHCGFCQSYGH